METLLELSTKCTASGATEDRTTLQFVVEEVLPETKDDTKTISYQIGVVALDLELCKRFNPKKKYSIHITEL